MFIWERWKRPCCLLALCVGLGFFGCRSTHPDASRVEDPPPYAKVPPIHDPGFRQGAPEAKNAVPSEIQLTEFHEATGEETPRLVTAGEDPLAVPAGENVPDAAELPLAPMGCTSAFDFSWC